MENETDALVNNLKNVEESYGIEVLTLSVSCRYLTRLLANTKVHSYISKRHPEICEELESLLIATANAKPLARGKGTGR